MSKLQRKEKEDNKIKIRLPETQISKIIDTDKKEKEMLKGQIHQENPTKNINQNIDSNLTNLLQNNNENINNEKLKKEIIIKPRETYLKEKILTNLNKTLISKVNKSLDNQMQHIKIDLKDNKILIRKISKNLKKINKNKKMLNCEENYKLKIRMKQIKELKDQENQLTNKISILISNEKFLNEKQLFSSSNKQILFEKKINQFKQNIQMIELEKIKKQKEDLLFKISIIKNQIKDLININDKETKKNKLKNFLDNFERDKEIIEISANKYYKESQEIKNRIKNDISSLMEKQKKEMEDQKEKIKKQKNDFFEKFRMKEKAIEGKRSKENKKKASFFQSFSFKKPKSKGEEYLFNLRTEKFLINEANYFRKEKNKRKLLVKSMSKEELEDFSNNYDNYKKDYYEKSEEKQKELFLEWKKRKDQLPNYINSFFEIADLESKKNQEMQRENKEKIENLLQKKKDYSQKIKEEKKPKIDEKLEKRRLNVIFKIQNPKLAIIKDTLLKRKKKKNFSKSRTDSKIKSNSLNNVKKKNKTQPKSSKSNKKNKNENNIIPELDKNEIINKNLIRKPIKINFVNSYFLNNNLQNQKSDNNINYFKKKYNNIYIDEKKSFSIDIKNNRKKWDDLLLKRKNNSLLNNIDFIRRKADMIDKEADKNEKLLHFYGGIATNPKLGKKISNLYIESIQAKLSILSQINKQLV